MAACLLSWSSRCLWGQTALVNDADAAVSGEVWAGAAKGRKTAAMLSECSRLDMTPPLPGPCTDWDPPSAMDSLGKRCGRGVGRGREGLERKPWVGGGRTYGACTAPLPSRLITVWMTLVSDRRCSAFGPSPVCATMAATDCAAEWAGLRVRAEGVPRDLRLGQRRGCTCQGSTGVICPG